MKIFRRRSAPASRGAGTARGASVRTRVDSVRDAVRRVRSGALDQSMLRWIGLTTSGQVALFGALVTYVFGRIIGGLPVLLMAYGLASCS